MTNLELSIMTNNANLADLHDTKLRQATADIFAAYAAIDTSAGALAYANSAGPATDGSQFYIVTGDSTDAETLKFYEEEYDKNPQIAYDINFTKEAEELYIQHGGAPHLDGGYTVFGQVIEGLDIVFEISQVATTANNKPKEAVYMESVTVEQYDGSAVRWYKSDYGIE